MEELHLFNDLDKATEFVMTSILRLFVKLVNRLLNVSRRREFIVHFVSQDVPRHQVHTQVKLDRSYLVPLLLQLILLGSAGLGQNLKANLSRE